MNHAALEQVLARVPFVQWSVCVRRADGEVVLAARADDALPTASVGKLLLLAELARRMADDPTVGAIAVSRSDVPAVAQAGVWQHLDVEQITLADAAVFVSTVSDNLAANALLQHLGLDSIHALARELGLHRTAVLDRLREDRKPWDEPEFSVGSAGELSRLMVEIARGQLISPAVSTIVSGWLRLNADLSMVADAFGLDPLYHSTPDQSRQLINKTGGDAGTKAEVGVVSEPGVTLAYSAIAYWEPERPGCPGDADARVLAAMNAIGALILGELEHPSPGTGGTS